MDRKVNPLSQFFLNPWLGAVFSCGLLFSFGSTAAETPSTRPAQALAYRLIAEYPHDTRRFTQGLEIEGEQIFESTGGYGQSHIYINELRGKKLLASRKLPRSLFGEGLSVLADQLFVLSWREGVAIAFDRKLKEIQRFSLSGEGWGLTHLDTTNGPRLLLSDGSSSLKLLDPKTFRQTGNLDVRDGAEPISRLNELEFARGKIFANVWLTSKIAVIAPLNGFVTGWVDLADLERRLSRDGDERDPDNVLNGIAYDARTGHFFVTGKRWPKMFEIEIDDQSSASQP